MKRNPIVDLTVVARSPFKIYYEGPATALTATNLVGTFDVLPGHADFFSMLEPCQVIIDPAGPDSETKDKDAKPEDSKDQPPANSDDKPKPGADGKPIAFKITNGIIAVRDNKVMLFVNM